MNQLKFTEDQLHKNEAMGSITVSITKDVKGMVPALKKPIL